MMDRRLDKVLLLFPPVSFGYWSTNVEKKEEEEEEENVCVVRHKHTDQYNRLHAPTLIYVCGCLRNAPGMFFSLSVCCVREREREKKSLRLAPPLCVGNPVKEGKPEAGSLFTHTHTHKTHLCVYVYARFCVVYSKY